MAVVHLSRFTAKAVVADLDGTLLDTEPAYFAAYAAVAGQFSHAYNFDDHHTHLLGRAELEGAATMVRLLNLPIDAHGVLARRDVILEQETGFLSCRPLPGAVAAVSALADAGVPLAIGGTWS